MTQDTLNIILGASIALIATTLTTLITYIFQTISEQRKRKWQLDDLFREERKNILLKRFDQTEFYITECMKWGAHILVSMDQVFDMKDFKDYMSAVEPLLEISHLMACSSVFDDIELAKGLVEFDDNIGKIMDLFSNLVVAPDTETRNKCNSEITDTLSVLKKSYVKVFGRLDQVKLNYLSGSVIGHNIPSNLQDKLPNWN